MGPPKKTASINAIAILTDEQASSLRLHHSGGSMISCLQTRIFESKTGPINIKSP